MDDLQAYEKIDVYRHSSQCNLKLIRYHFLPFKMAKRKKTYRTKASVRM